jgi:hypothetical protein
MGNDGGSERAFALQYIEKQNKKLNIQKTKMGRLRGKS